MYVLCNILDVTPLLQTYMKKIINKMKRDIGRECIHETQNVTSILHQMIPPGKPPVYAAALKKWQVSNPRNGITRAYIAKYSHKDLKLFVQLGNNNLNVVYEGVNEFNIKGYYTRVYQNPKDGWPVAIWE